MPATPIPNPAPGESLVGTLPQLLQQVDPGWRRRLNLYPGRALSSAALDSEQIYRSGLLGTLGQSVSAGTVRGLALTLQPSGADPLLTVTPGYGICANGIDVVLKRALKTRLSTLTVLSAATGLQSQQIVDLEQGGPAEPLLSMRQYMNTPNNSVFAGILVLQPVVAQVSGRLLDTGTGPLVVSGNLGASCSQDPAEFAFEDWQTADGVQLVFVPWPAAPGLALPAQSPAATWRNRLAYAIFEAESLLGPDDQLPWAMLGVPVALAAFSAGVAWTADTAYGVGQFVMDPNGNQQQVLTAGTTGGGAPAAWNPVYGGNTTDGGVTWQNAGLGWRPQFVDCSAVVRAGGLPLRRHVLPSLAAPPELWQPNTPFASGNFIIDGNDNVQKVQTAGTSGGPTPAWNPSFGQTTADAGVVWINNGPATWRANTAFAAGQFIIDSRGYLQTVTVPGTSGAAEPVWNGVYLQTSDGTVAWVNNGSGAPPIIQPALAQARINQLSEQLSQTLAQGTTFNTLADLFATLPPSGILPAAAMNFTNQSAPWLPPNWTVTAAPVRLEELEAALASGMTAGLLDALGAAPAAPLMESVEVLVPLPDAVYDPEILVVPTVAPIFQQELDRAVAARNHTLEQMQAVQEELNVLFTAVGPNVPVNPSVIDPDAGLTQQEIAGRDTFPPYLPAANETFGTTLSSTWNANTQYAPGAWIIDGNGAIQVAQNAEAASSGATAPAWNTTVAGVTADGAVNWLNNGPLSWQPNSVYAVGQFVVDASGNRHVVTSPGTSASTAPDWNNAAGATTPDGVMWMAGGQAIWQPDMVYAAGALILDSRGSIQRAQTGGISGDSPPGWNPSVGQTTQDGGVTWTALGNARWQPNAGYAAGQAILDPNNQIQSVEIGGTSGATQPAWSQGPGAMTLDAAVDWNNSGPLTWQANWQYAAGTLIIDSNDGLQWVQTGGVSGATPPVWAAAPGGTTTDNGITWRAVSPVSTDLTQLVGIANGPPYTRQYQDSTGAPFTLNLLTADDMALLTGGDGLQRLITGLNARISSANDLLDTAFLTAQTDIYRYRQNVLGNTAATRLATSPVLANIAAGETAAATAANLQTYISTLLPSVAPSPAAAAAAAPAAAAAAAMPAAAAPQPAAAAGGAVNLAMQTAAARSFTRFTAAPLAAAQAAGAAPAAGLQAAAAAPRAQVLASIPGAVQSTLSPGGVSKVGAVGGVSLIGAGSPGLTLTGTGARGLTNFGAGSGSLLNSSAFLDTNAARIPLGLGLGGPTEIVTPTPPVATPTDITSQSPLAGAQLNIRTLTIAERLQQSPSQEAMFYSIANRLSFLQSLQAIVDDLNLVVDDLPILADADAAAAAAAAANGAPIAVPVQTFTFREWRTGAAAIQSSLQAPYIHSDAAEASLFSVGVRVSEQHIMLLRALEARVQQYSDFVGVCNGALNSLQTNIGQAQSYLTQLSNNLMQQRQNVAFTSALLGDEQTRVANLAAQRRQVLANSVQLVAYTRARTLEAFDTVPSRQLVPADVGNPVPAGLQQSATIPPELREIVGQLREAPVNWLPSAAVLMNDLERPVLLQQLAYDARARASLQLQGGVLPSSAAQASGVYSAAIASVYEANTRVFRGLQLQRAAIQPAALATWSWSAQVAGLQGMAAINDLIASEVVHAEVSSAVSRLIEQISNVATSLYTRASSALPIDRLAWAEYLRGPGLSVTLSSLAILPNWSQQAYTDRQQMQLLVDWLFQQIDSGITAATAFMSDVVRTAILLASDVPVDNIIPGSVIARIQPTLGAVVALTLPSARVTSGMYVHLYAGGALAAHAVVTDLDSGTVSATVTNVFNSNVYLEAADTAHFTAQSPQAVALRPLFA